MDRPKSPILIPLTKRDILINVSRSFQWFVYVAKGGK